MVMARLPADALDDSTLGWLLAFGVLVLGLVGFTYGLGWRCESARFLASVLEVVWRTLWMQGHVLVGR